jgi:CheY-like chemotaxis protein
MQLDKMVRGRTTLRNAIRGLWQGGIVRPRRIIVVAESDPSLRRLLVESLCLADYQTLEAADGAEAVRVAARMARHEIDLLLTDMTLPDLAGWDLGEIVRLDHPRAKVVCLGRSPHDGWSRPRNVPASFLLLPKPFSSEAVLQAVRREFLDKPQFNSKPKLAGTVARPRH